MEQDQGRPCEKDVPAYDLRDVAEAFRAGEFQFGARVRRYLARQGWDRERVGSCICSLSAEEFHKSQEHRARPGVWLDIYRPRRGGERLYVKFVREDVRPGYRVLSFCRDAESH